MQNSVAPVVARSYDSVQRDGAVRSARGPHKPQVTGSNPVPATRRAPARNRACKAWVFGHARVGTWATHCGRSSIGRAPRCGRGGCGFDPRRSPEASYPNGRGTRFRTETVCVRIAPTLHEAQYAHRQRGRSEGPSVAGSDPADSACTPVGSARGGGAGGDARLRGRGGRRLPRRRARPGVGGAAVPGRRSGRCSRCVPTVGSTAQRMSAERVLGRARQGHGKGVTVALKWMDVLGICQ